MSTFARLISLLFAHPNPKSLLQRDADILAMIARRAGYRLPSDMAIQPNGTVHLAFGALLRLREVAAGLASGGVVEGSNAAGTIKLAFEGPDSLSARVEPDDVRSVALDASGHLLTLHRSGSLRRDGRQIAFVPRGKRVRISRAGTIAVVARTASGSSLHLLDSHGAPHAVLEGGLPYGGVAWSPNDEQLAMRTDRGVRVHDARGALMEEVLVPTPSSHHAGDVAWTERGIFALLPYALVHVQGASVVRHERMGAPFFSLAAMQHGPVVALACADLAGKGLWFVDLETGEFAAAQRGGMWPYAPISFLPGDRGLLWVSTAAECHVVPFGVVPRDPITGQFADPQEALVERLGRQLHSTENEAELRAQLDELRSAGLRPALAERTRSLVEAYATKLKDLKKERLVGQAFKESAPPAIVAVGDTVTHPKFGRGQVTSVDGVGTEARVTVSFEGAIKTLKASFLTRV